MWKQWVNFILGILVIIFAYTGTGATWVALAGLIVAILAIWSAFEKKGGAPAAASMPKV